MSLGKRFHAVLMDVVDDRYRRLAGERKQALLGGLSGQVIEIGAGTGGNLPFYSPHIHLAALEPNPYMHPYLTRRARSLDVDVTVHRGFAEDLPFDSESADVVVSTLVLCSVGDPARVLQETLRVLKPGGRFVFLEHVRAGPGSSTRRRQEWIRPIWSLLADGCHPNRETGKLIETAGFRQTNYEQFRLPLPIVGPHIAGTAIK